MSDLEQEVKDTEAMIEEAAAKLKEQIEAQSELIKSYRVENNSATREIKELNSRIADLHNSKKEASGNLAKSIDDEINSVNAQLVVAQMNKTDSSSKIKEAERILKSLKSKKDLPAKMDLSQMVDKFLEDNDVYYITTRNKIAYCRSSSKDGYSNPIFKELPPSNFISVVRGEFKNNSIFPEFKEDGGYRTSTDEMIYNFIQDGRTKEDTTSSFNRDKWDDDRFYNKMKIIQKYWVQPDFTNADSYDKRFDFLIDCVGNGKQENMDHLEQWIGFKYLYPNEVANTPNLDLGGNPGGNGKGRYQSICQTIFTSSCVLNAAMKELMDGFNSGWETAAFIVYDEPEQKELPASKLKQATGSEELRSETKGIDARIVDRNFNFLFLSNNPEGVVRLSGSGDGAEDRRYSVITTQKVMVQEVLNQNLATDIIGAKLYTHSVKEICQNREEVAKWLAHIILKHDLMNVDILQPLHGEDYRARFEEQKNNIDVAFDQILPVFEEQGIMPTKVLTEVTKHITGMDKLTVNGIGKKFRDFCIKKGVKCVRPDSRPRLRVMWGEDLLWDEAGASVLVHNDAVSWFDMKCVTSKMPRKGEDLVHISLSGEDYEEEQEEVGYAPKQNELGYVDGLENRSRYLAQIVKANRR